MQGGAGVGGGGSGETTCGHTAELRPGYCLQVLPGKEGGIDKDDGGIDNAYDNNGDESAEEKSIDNGIDGSGGSDGMKWRKTTSFLKKASNAQLL